MKANELRIGNWVQPIGECIQITGVDTIEGVDYIKIWGQYHHIKGIEPIPITEEWLLKLGFIKKEKVYFKDDFFCYLVYGGGNGWKSWVNLTKDDFTIALVGQVHQLQNLYFALTGEEL